MWPIGNGTDGVWAGDCASAGAAVHQAPAAGRQAATVSRQAATVSR